MSAHLEALFDEVPSRGTNWTCDVQDELLSQARNLRRIIRQLNRTGVLYERIGRAFAFIAFILAIINTLAALPLVIILLPIFVGIVAFIDLQNKAALMYSTAFQLEGLVDTIRGEFLLQVPFRIDGHVFYRTVQVNRVAILAQYRYDSNY